MRCPQPNQRKQFRHIHQAFGFRSLLGAKWSPQILAIKQRLQAGCNRAGQSKGIEIIWKINFESNGHQSSFIARP